MKRPTILSASLALMCLAALSACLPTYNRVPTVGRSPQAIAAIKDSFKADDLSGCWNQIQLQPPSAARGAGIIFTKTAANTYSFEDGVKTTLTIDGDKATFVADGKTLVGTAQFKDYPYQLIRPASEGTEPTQKGYQWGGKTCQ